MSKKYHPDINKEAGAEQKYKDVQEAYETLSDSQKRAAYDQYGAAGAQGGFGGGAGGFGGFDGGGFGGLKISSQASLVAVEAETQMPLVKVTICNIVLIYLLKRLYLVLKKKLAIIAKQPAALV